MNTHELIQRAERELADGNRSAKKTLERARCRLLKERDVEGLEHLLDLAGRLDNGGDLPYAIRQNLRFLSHQPRGKPDRPNAGVVALVVLFGAFAGGATAIALTYWLLHGAEADAFTWLAAALFFLFFGIPLGGVLAFLSLRRFTKRSAKPSY